MFNSNNKENLIELTSCKSGSVLLSTVIVLQNQLLADQLMF